MKFKKLMKPSLNILGKGLCAVGLFLTASLVTAQNSFHRGVINISISEGTTSAQYGTGTGKGMKYDAQTTSSLDGIRDPLMIEYGLTNHLGIGLSFGNDIFKVDPSKYYGFALPSNGKVTAFTSETNLDFNYHIFSNTRLDMSSFTSVGRFSVAFSGTEKYMANNEALTMNEFSYNYMAKGTIWRTGTRFKYYFMPRVGLMGMLSAYTAKASPKNVDGNTVGMNTSTKISGFATEFGLCLKLF
jgi:hypothetical protein